MALSLWRSPFAEEKGSVRNKILSIESRDRKKARKKELLETLKYWKARRDKNAQELEKAKNALAAHKNIEN